MGTSSPHDQKRILLIGATGLVGGALFQEAPKNTLATFYSQERSEPQFQKLDICDSKAVNTLIEKSKPEVVLLSSYFPNVEACEENPSESAKINIEGILNILKPSLQIGAFSVFYSSDYVFDGKLGPYPEDAPLNPLSVYGEQKAQIETWLKENAKDQSLVIRITGVFGVEEKRKNFAYGVLAHAKTQKEMKVPVDQTATPSYAPDVAKKTFLALNKGLTGVLHIACQNSVSRLQFATEICEAFELDSSFLVPTLTANLAQKAKRPLNGGLLCARLEKELNLNAMELAKAIQDFKSKETSH